MATLSYVPPPPGTNYIVAVEPSLNLLIIVIVWTSFLVPIAIALFLFSTHALRRRPVFILNLISVSLGLLHGALYTYNQTRSILLLPIPTVLLTILALLTFLIPMFAELILIVRVLAVYPPSRLTLTARVAVYAPTCVFKIARLVNAVIFIVRWIEWFLMLFDDSYTSLLFLYRLREGSHRTSQIQNRTIMISNTSIWTYSSRLKALFWIAVSNFVFPVILNIAQLVLVFRDKSFLNNSYLFMVSMYIQIIGVLLATIWCTGTRWVDDGDGNLDGNASRRRGPHLSSLRFPPGSFVGGSASDSVFDDRPESELPCVQAARSQADSGTSSEVEQEKKT
ncbi:hypothetical protein C8Q80DRAFT_1273030 [Daedaleopsis nitida]|nr:hypothetical protein C8Q80DRAFT_1273030 [Daedaleopsis nitida]